MLVWDFVLTLHSARATNAQAILRVKRSSLFLFLRALEETWYDGSNHDNGNVWEITDQLNSGPYPDVRLRQAEPAENGYRVRTPAAGGTPITYDSWGNLWKQEITKGNPPQFLPGPLGWFTLATLPQGCSPRYFRDASHGISYLSGVALVFDAIQKLDENRNVLRKSSRGLCYGAMLPLSKNP